MRSKPEMEVVQNWQFIATYNDSFKLLVREPRWCSASELFVSYNVTTFNAMI